jgi:hypothetical protein
MCFSKLLKCVQLKHGARVASVLDGPFWAGHWLIDKETSLQTHTGNQFNIYIYIYMCVCLFCSHWKPVQIIPYAYTLSMQYVYTEQLNATHYQHELSHMQRARGLCVKFAWKLFKCFQLKHGARVASILDCPLLVGPLAHREGDRSRV